MLSAQPPFLREVDLVLRYGREIQDLGAQPPFLREVDLVLPEIKIPSKAKCPTTLPQRG